jgi:hypothetical protein
MAVDNLYIANMNTALNSTMIIYCLRRKLRKLEKDREDYLYKLISNNQARIAAMDRIEDLDADAFAFYDRNIIRYKKLINKVKESK